MLPIAGQISTTRALLSQRMAMLYLLRAELTPKKAKFFAIHAKYPALDSTDL